jgi:prevent-host-death family protein
MRLEQRVKPITYLKNHTADLVRDVTAGGNPMVITQNGEAKVVVMDVAEYDRWREAMALMKLFALSEADVAAGRLCSTEEAFDRAARAIEER